MESYLFKKLPILELDKIKMNKDSSPNKIIILNSEKNKDLASTPSQNPSCISTSQEYQIESNKILKSINNKNNFMLFKNAFKDNNKEKIMQMLPKRYVNMKKAFSLEKKDLLTSENIFQSKMNPITSVTDKNNKIQNLKNINMKINNNFFRLFKSRKNNQNICKEKEEIFPIIKNYMPIETDQNIVRNKNSNNHYNLFTSQNEDMNLFYRDKLFNSLNKNKSQEKKIFVKIDNNNNYKNKINNDNNSHGIIQKNNNQKNVNNNNNNEVIPKIHSPKSNLKSLSNEKCLNKNNLRNLNIINSLKENKIPNFEDKIKSINKKNAKKKNKIKLGTSKGNILYINKDIKNNFKRKYTPNYDIKFSNNRLNTIQDKENNKFLFKKKIDLAEDEDIIGDSFKNELDIIISDVNNCKSEREKKMSNNRSKTIDNYKKKETIDKYEEDSFVSDEDDIKINIENYYDDSEEKNIPKEHEERINLIKKYTRPITSYGHGHVKN